MPNTGADNLTPPVWIHVVAAVIYRGHAEQLEVLLAKRPDHKHQGGKWEFPGGKVEASESAPQALARELNEELGIHVEPASLQSFVEVRHLYSDKAIWLDVWHTSQFKGQPSGLEGQEVAWFKLPALVHLSFPAANQAIITKLLQHLNT